MLITKVERAPAERQRQCLTELKDGTCLPRRANLDRVRGVPVGGLTVALGVALALACGDPNNTQDDNQFRRDVIWCEDAVSHLADCCPAAYKLVLCNYYYATHEEGCGPVTTTAVHPFFPEQTAACIRDTSCADMVRSNMCSRIDAALHGTPPAGPLCP